MTANNTTYELYTMILSDLYRTHPTNPFVMPDPYNDDLSEEENIMELYHQIRSSTRINRRIESLVAHYYIGFYLERKVISPKQRTKIRKQLTRHYAETCARIYDLFRLTGIEQIYRSTKTLPWMIRKLTRKQFRELIQVAKNLTDSFLMEQEN